jgi:hypothetical protein
MKRSEAIAKIDDFIRFGISLKEHQTHGQVVLSFLERLGMLPPAYDKFVEIEPNESGDDPLYRKVKVNEWESESDEV